MECWNCKLPNPDNAIRCTNCKAGISAVTIGVVFKQQYSINKLLQRDFDSDSFTAQDIRSGTGCQLREFFPQTSQDSKQTASWMLENYVKRSRLLSNELPGAVRVSIFTHERRFYAVEQAVDGVSVAELRRARGQPDEQELRRILCNFLKVLSQWAAMPNPFVHGNLTASNILSRREDGRLVATEWAVLKDITQVTHVYNGTVTLAEGHIPAWAPPERRRFATVPATDLYGLGVLCLEYWTGKSAAELFNPALGWPTEGSKLPRAVEAVVCRLLRPKAEERGDPATTLDLLAQLDAAQTAEQQSPEEALQIYRNVAQHTPSQWLRSHIAQLETSIKQTRAGRERELQKQAADSEAAKLSSKPNSAIKSAVDLAMEITGSRAAAAVKRAAVREPEIHPLGSESPKPAPEPVTAAIAPTPVSPEVTASDPTPRKLPPQLMKAGVFVALILLTILIYLIVHKNPEEQILDALAQNRLADPSGSNAIDLYNKAKQNNDLSRDAISRITTQALPIIDSRAQQILANFHDHSIATDSDWAILQKISNWGAELSGRTNFSAAAAYAEGQLAIHRNDYNSAFTSFDRATRLQSCWAMALNGLGRAAFKLRRYEQAAVYYEQAIKCDSNWLYPHENRCALDLTRERWDDLQTDCQQVLAIEPRSSFAYFFLGSGYVQQRRYCEGVAAFEKALEYEDAKSPFRDTTLRNQINSLTRRHRCN